MSPHETASYNEEEEVDNTAANPSSFQPIFLIARHRHLVSPDPAFRWLRSQRQTCLPCLTPGEPSGLRNTPSRTTSFSVKPLSEPITASIYMHTNPARMALFPLPGIKSTVPWSTQIHPPGRAARPTTPFSYRLSILSSPVVQIPPCNSMPAILSQRACSTSLAPRSRVTVA